MAGERFAFGAVDYVLLGVVMAISICIGFYHAFTGGRQKTTSEYLVGNRHMRILPVAVSLLVTFQSAVLMIGFPAEMYVYGSQLWIFTLTAISANVLSALCIVPLFQPLNLTSAYEYLELRFKSRAVRLLGSALGILAATWYSGVVLYGPAITLEAVTGTPMWMSILMMALAGIIYTTIGGFKAVIWTDVFQFLVMISGMVAVLVKGLVDIGGIGRMWEICDEGDRIKFFDFNPDPTVRLTFWCLTIGGTVQKFGYNLSQTAIQRMSSMETIWKGQMIVLLAVPGFVMFGTLACLEGLLAYAYFADSGCDPLEAKVVKNSNQVFPYFVMSLFHSYPGLPGLFLSSVFSAALSTLSSNLNAVSAMVLEDFVKPVFPKMSERKRTVTAKVTVIIFGLISVGVSFLATQAKGPLYQISVVLLSSFGSALTGLILLGALIPPATAKGAFGGGIVGFALCMWISMGAIFSGQVARTPYLPSPGIDQCPANSTYTHLNSTTTSQPMLNYTTTDFTPHSTLSPLGSLYSLSYMWMGSVGILATFIFGVLCSYITGANKPGDVDPAYIIPISDRLCCCLPKCFRRKLRCPSRRFDVKTCSLDKDGPDDVHSPMTNGYLPVPVIENGKNRSVIENGKNGVLVNDMDDCIQLIHMTNVS